MRLRFASSLVRRALPSASALALVGSLRRAVACDDDSAIIHENKHHGGNNSSHDDNTTPNQDNSNHESASNTDNNNINTTSDKKLNWYENIPETDEPTSCLLCLIHRQGPCRPFWRRFEYCVKDSANTDSPKEKESNENDNNDELKNEENNESPQGDVSHENSQKPVNDEDNGSKDNDDSPNCDHLAVPLFQCLMKYPAMYDLYANDVFQYEFLDDIETSATWDEGDATQWTDDPSRIDWSPWIQYCQEQQLTLTELTSRYEEDECRRTTTRPVFEGEDPILIKIQVPLSLVNTTTTTTETEEDNVDGFIVDMAYAKDQNGTVLGHSHFTRQVMDGNEEAVLSFSIQPNRTQSVQLFKLYKKDDETRLCTSEPISVVEVAKEVLVPDEQ